jgi:hypothetical protein
MKNALLQFDTLLNLWCFKEKAGLTDIEIIPNKRLLIASLPDHLIQLAVERYNAVCFASQNATASFPV